MGAEQRDPLLRRNPGPVDSFLRPVVAFGEGNVEAAAANLGREERGSEVMGPEVQRPVRRTNGDSRGVAAHEGMLQEGPRIVPLKVEQIRVGNPELLGVLHHHADQVRVIDADEDAVLRPGIMDFQMEPVLRQAERDRAPAGRPLQLIPEPSPVGARLMGAGHDHLVIEFLDRQAVEVRRRLHVSAVARIGKRIIGVADEEVPKSASLVDHPGAPFLALDRRAIQVEAAADLGVHRLHGGHNLARPLEVAAGVAVEAAVLRVVFVAQLEPGDSVGLGVSMLRAERRPVPGRTIVPSVLF